MAAMHQPNWTTHEPACRQHNEKIAAEQAEYEAQWPNYCKACGGYGGSGGKEFRGMYGMAAAYEDTYDVCDVCWGKFICPRCGAQGWPDDSDGDGPCQKCGWDQKDGGRPEQDCWCVNQEA